MKLHPEGMRESDQSRLALMASAGLLGLGAMPLNAQESHAETEVDDVEGLKACQVVADDSERLACFDPTIGNVVTASNDGDVLVLDREDVSQTRRSLFGFKLPNIGIFGGEGDGDGEEEEEWTCTGFVPVTNLIMPPWLRMRAG